MTMKRALLIGIDDYDNVRPLGGCVKDALAMWEVLRRHEDGNLNYDCRVLISPWPKDGITNYDPKVFGTGPKHITRRLLRGNGPSCLITLKGISCFTSPATACPRT